MNNTEPKICNCGKAAVEGITFAGEFVCWIYRECSDERNAKLDAIRNSPEQVAFRKEWKERIEMNKRILCQVAGCSSYCGDKHNPFLEKNNDIA